jgi:hypothetical protein
MDLDITTYSIEQLLSLFKLSSTTINKDSLESSYHKYVKEISQSSSSIFSERDKENVINFCKEARDVLLASIQPSVELIHKNHEKHRYQYINIDTKFRSNYYLTTSSNFIIDLPITIKNVLELGVEAFERPPEQSYYNISSTLGNNCFGIQSQLDNASVTIVVPDGIYTVTTLLEFINFILQSQTNSLNQLICSVPGTYLSDKFAKVMFVVKQPNILFNFTLDFQVNASGAFDFSPIQIKLGWIMGFRNITYSGNSAYVSDAFSDLTQPKYVFLAIDDFNNGGFVSTQMIFTQSISSQNIVARISSTNSSINNSALISLPRLYTHNGTNIQRIRVTLMDEFGRILQTDNMDYSFILKLKLAYIEN